MLNRHKRIRGSGKTVEVDVSKLGKRKYSRGNAVEGYSVFGGVERGFNLFLNV